MAEKKNELVTWQQFAVAANPKQSMAVIQANLGGERISLSDLDRIKVPAAGGTKWSVAGPKGEEAVDSITGVILHTERMRVYWSSEDIGNQPPDCHSTDMIRGHGEPGGSCDVCPLAEWDSGKGGRGKACKERRLLYMLLPGSLLPTIVNVPPASLKAAKSYLVHLTRPYYTLLTRLTLRQEKNAVGTKYSAIEFAVAGELPAEAAEALMLYKPILERGEGRLQAAASGE